MCRTEQRRLNTRHWPVVRGGILCLILMLGAGACGSSDEVDAAAGSDSSETTAAQETTSTTEAVTTTVTTEETTTTAAETTLPECTEEPCPIPAEDRAWIDEFVAIYNDGTWEEFTAHVGSDDPVWDTPLGFAEPEWVSGDFRWSRALNEMWEIESCTEADGLYVCTMLIEDDLHRGLGLDPASCRFLFSSTDGVVQPEKYEIVPCHEGYDSAMHAYGAWFERTYPDLEPIQGFHYRAWNQLSETAPALAAQYLDEYLALEAEA